MRTLCWGTLPRDRPSPEPVPKVSPSSTPRPPCEVPEIVSPEHVWPAVDDYLCSHSGTSVCDLLHMVSLEAFECQVHGLSLPDRQRALHAWSRSITVWKCWSNANVEPTFNLKYFVFPILYHKPCPLMPLHQKHPQEVHAEHAALNNQ